MSRKEEVTAATCKKPKLSDVDSSAPFIVDLSPSCSSDQTTLGSGGIKSKMIGGSEAMFSHQRAGKRKRIKALGCAGASRASCCVFVLLIFLIIGQFVWTLSLQFSLLRVLDKLAVVEKLADTALDLTTDVAASAAQTAAHAAAAANKAIEAVVVTGLAGIQNLSVGVIQNLTNLDTLLAAAQAAKQQAETAAAAAREYASVAATAKDSAMAAASAAKQRAEEVASDLETKFKKVWQGASEQLQGIIARDVPDSEETLPPPDIGGEAVPTPPGGTSDPIRTQNSQENVEPHRETSIDRGKSQNSTTNEKSTQDDDVTGRAELEGLRRRRSADDEEEDEDGLGLRGQAMRRPRQMKVNEASPKQHRHRKVQKNGGGARGNRQAHSAIHLKLKVEISPAQSTLLKNGAEGYITLQYGRMTRDGYTPYEDESHGHLYKEWSAEGEELNTKTTLRLISQTGRVVVKRGGIYHIYAQIVYRNTAVRSGFQLRVKKGTRRRLRTASRQDMEADHEDPEDHGDSTIAMCVTSLPTEVLANCTDSGQACNTTTSALPSDQQQKKQLLPVFRTCHTSVTTTLYQGDSVYVYDPYNTQIASETTHSNFFGLFRIAES